MTAHAGPARSRPAPGRGVRSRAHALQLQGAGLDAQVRGASGSRRPPPAAAPAPGRAGPCRPATGARRPAPSAGSNHSSPQRSTPRSSTASTSKVSARELEQDRVGLEPDHGDLGRGVLDGAHGEAEGAGPLEAEAASTQEISWTTDSPAASQARGSPARRSARGVGLGADGARLAAEVERAAWTSLPTTAESAPPLTSRSRGAGLAEVGGEGAPWPSRPRPRAAGRGERAGRAGAGRR